jgi:hypothetical protein
MSVVDAKETLQSDGILNLIRHVLKNPSAETVQPTCRILLSLERAALLAGVQEQVLQHSFGEAVQSYTLQRSYFESFSLLQAMSAWRENAGNEAGKENISKTPSIISGFSCPVMFGRALILSGTQFYSHEDFYSAVTGLSIRTLPESSDHIDARLRDSFRFMCRAASLVLGPGPDLTLVVDGKKCVVVYAVVPQKIHGPQSSDDPQTIDDSVVVSSIQLKLTFPEGTTFFARKIEITPKAASTDVNVILTQADDSTVSAELSLEKERHILNQLLWMCRCIEVVLPDAKLDKITSVENSIPEEIRFWIQQDAFSLVFFKKPVALRKRGGKGLDGLEIIENTAQIMGWSLVLPELQFADMFCDLFRFDRSEPAAAKEMARVIFNRCHRWVFANFSPNKVFTANSDAVTDPLMMKVVHNSISSNGTPMPITPKLHISHDGGTTWHVIEKLGLRKRNVGVTGTAVVSDVWISPDRTKPNMPLSAKTENCIKELMRYNFEYSVTSDHTDVAFEFRSVFSQQSIKSEDMLRFAFHLWNFCCYCAVPWEAVLADVPNFVFDRSILNLSSKDDVVESSRTILSVLEPTPFAFEHMTSANELLHDWPIFLNGKKVVDHVHVLFTAALQATVEPAKADLTTLEFQKQVKKWQRELDRPRWLESQSSVQKFWSRSVDQSVQAFVQSVFEDFSSASITTQLLVCSQIRSSNDMGLWRTATSTFEVQINSDTKQSHLNLSIKTVRMPLKSFKVLKLVLSARPELFYFHNPKDVIKPLEVQVERENGQPKTYFVYPCLGHEACVQKLLNLWRLVQNQKYMHVTQHTAASLKNAFATIPRLYRSDSDKFGEVMCLFQSLSHEDAGAGLQLVTEILCQYEPSPSNPSLTTTNPSPLQFTGLRSLRLCLRNFSDQKETLCCVLALLLKLLLWKQSSTENLMIDDSSGATQV